MIGNSPRRRHRRPSGWTLWTIFVGLLMLAASTATVIVAVHFIGKYW